MSLPRVGHYDVVIVGAGMVGASLALALTHKQDKPLRLNSISSCRHGPPRTAET